MIKKEMYCEQCDQQQIHQLIQEFDNKNWWSCGKCNTIKVIENVNE